MKSIIIITFLLLVYGILGISVYNMVYSYGESHWNDNMKTQVKKG